MSTQPTAGPGEQNTPDPRDDREHFTGVETALGERTHPDLRVFDLGEETDPLPEYFAIPHVSRAYSAAGVRGGGHNGMSAWRLVVRVSARTAGGCRWALREVARALEERSLVVAGDETSLLDLESTRSATEDDDGRYTASVAFTYTH